MGLELNEIMQAISKKKNFLLSGGAGSGKTYSLVEVIEQILSKIPNAKIACITYTNIAADEIQMRVNHKRLEVSTIHNFLWSSIKSYQNEIKSCLKALITEGVIKNITASDVSHYLNKIDELKEVNYREYSKILSGVISHDEVILLSKFMFEKYVKINTIVQDKYQFILVDEYQDTQEDVISILLKNFAQAKRKAIIGFFGDAMQSIYDDRIGSLQDYIDEGVVVEVQKRQNRRNPLKVIELANRLRIDDLKQKPSEDLNAPNMVNGIIKQGDIKFLYSNKKDQVNSAQAILGWDFKKSETTKELNLTHKLIAKNAKFAELYAVYDDKLFSYLASIRRYIKGKYGESYQDEIETKTLEEVIRLLEGNVDVENKKDKVPKASKKLMTRPLYNSILTESFLSLEKLRVSTSQLIDVNQHDVLTKYLCRLQGLIDLYVNKRYNDFLQKTDFRANLKTVADKRALKEKIDSLIEGSTKTIGELIDNAHDYGICIKGDVLDLFSGDEVVNKYLYSRVAALPYCELKAFYEYIEDRTPFSTQHKTKGDEFDNVFVVMDNGQWRKYNFSSIFDSGVKSKPDIVNRSRRLFYVCCTRAKENLAIYFESPSEKIITTARQWFGSESVINIDTLQK